MNKKITLLLLAMFVVSCAPVGIETPYILPVTQIPFFASETPAIIIPITDTPQIILPVTETPTGFSPITETPTALPPAPTDTPVPLPAVKWWDVYFTDPLTINNPSNPVGSVEEKLIEQINAAQVSIHVAAFEFNLPRVADALIAAKARGVDVRWVTDDENGLAIDGNQNRGQFTRLMAGGVEVKDDAGRSALMHNKIWIFDRQIVWTGSTNATLNGIYKQNNNVIVIRSPQVAEIFEREWEELWNAQLGPRAPSTISTQWAILDGTPIQVLFSPEDKVVGNLIALMSDAQTSIRFLAFSFTDYPMAETMIARAQNGVDVQGVFETFGSNSPRSELKTLWCAGLPVRQDGNGSFLHHKVIVIDNSIVVTGSLNFSSNADDSNEENVIILDNPEIAALYLQEYQRVWDQAMSVPVGAFTCE